MSRTIRFIVLVAAAVCLTAVFATSALAYNNWFAPCFSCHAAAPTPITVTPTLVSNNGVSAQYTFTAPGATEWAVFAGYTRIANGMGNSGGFTAPAGAPYTVYAVAGNLSGSYGSATVNPAATFPNPTGDVTAPVSTSNAVASYTNRAEVTITATDDQSGVAYIYFRVNNGSTRTTPIGVDGYAKAVVKPTSTGTTSYTLTYWAQDREGNTEAPEKVVTFSVTADGWVSTNTPSTVSGPNGMSPWTYQDSSDANAKREGGYLAYGGVSGFYSNPHGGYDTSTNKCKACHAVHRAEGTYYLLRADSQDDACTYCHIGGAAKSNAVVYSGNPAGIDTPNGHTMGAGSRIPGSTESMSTSAVTVNGETVLVRNYVDAKKQLYRTVAFGRSPASHPDIEGSTVIAFGKVGPTPLSCSNCHQVHNALSQIWQPPAQNPTDRGQTLVAGGIASDGKVVGPDGRRQNGFKLLRRFPGATTWNDAGRLTSSSSGYGSTTMAKVPESTLTMNVNYSTTRSGAATYTDLGVNWRQPDWTLSANMQNLDNDSTTHTAGVFNRSGNEALVSEYAMSVWCADCHNLNIGAPGQWAGTTELGTAKMHGDRTHPVPASRTFQCYSCHRSGLGTGGTSCERCHYGPHVYDDDSRAAADFLGRPTDFPHAGANDEYKLLGAFSISQLPPVGLTVGSWTLQYKQTAVGANNLDAVCIRCHTDQGIHQ